MRNILIALLLVLLISTGAFAQSYHHEIEIMLDGDYKIVTNVVLPDSNTDIDLEGVGKAHIKSKLVVVAEDLDSLKAWWDLF